MLKRVHIRDFKSLADVELRLEPLTVLLGPNASGKSNFLDALLLLSKLRYEPDAQGCVRLPVPRQTDRVVPSRQERHRGPDRTGAAGVLHRGRPGAVGSGRLRRQSTDSEPARCQRSGRVPGVRQASRRRERTKPAVPHRDRDAATLGHATRRRRVPGGPEQQGRAGRPAEALPGASGRQAPPAARRQGGRHAPRPPSGPQRPVDAAPSASPPPSRRGPGRTGKLAVLLLRAAGTDAGGQPPEGSAAHRPGRRRTRSVPQHHEGGRTRALPLASKES